uniref:TSA: Wollemia nobilis Ref_Wollemi_Transcript_10943_2266 transcribed RNA sequence n=2 Tax=Wollemia nobilis TaxID=56998 RepID=A0A0C9QT45_9CONI
MNSGGRRSENAQKAAVPLSNYQFDFGLGSNFSSSQSSKSLKDQKYNSPTQTPSSAQSQKPAPAWTPNKPSWNPQPSSSPASRSAQAGFSSGWTGQSGISTGWSSQPQMAGDILGKSWAKPDASKQSTTGIVGGLNSGAAPHLFGDLLGEALGQQKSNAPLKQSSSSTSFSMGSMSAALPKGRVSLKDQQRASVRSAEEFGNFAGASTGGGKSADPFDALPTFSNKSFSSSQGDPFGSFAGSSAKQVPLKTTSSANQDPFGDFRNVSTATNDHNTFGDFQKGSAKNPSSTAGGDPFAASMNVSDDLFGSTSIPNSSNSGEPFTGMSSGRNGGTGFTDPLASFSSPVKQGTAPGRAADPFEALNKSLSSEKQAPQENKKDPLGSLFTSSSTASPGGFDSQPLSEVDDWGLESEFGGADTGPTTELEGLPPPPAGVTISMAKDKGLENYKQGQFADSIKWFSWAMVLLEKSGSSSDASVELLTSRASCYKEVGEYKKAIADCSKVLDYDKSNVAVLLQRALLYESTEKYKLGVEDLRNVLKLDPVNRLAKSTLSRLVKLAD